MGDVALRPATLADSEALFALHRASLGWAIEEIYGPWDEDVQIRFHERWFDPERVWVIQHGTEIAGLLDYTFHDDRLTIARLQLHPSFQGQGIGTAILRELLAEADRRRLPALLEVFDVNPARLLYERLGFRETAREGHQVHMRRPPGGRLRRGRGTARRGSGPAGRRGWT